MRVVLLCQAGYHAGSQIDGQISKQTLTKEWQRVHKHKRQLFHRAICL